MGRDDPSTVIITLMARREFSTSAIRRRRAWECVAFWVTGLVLMGACVPDDPGSSSSGDDAGDTQGEMGQSVPPVAPTSSTGAGGYEGKIEGPRDTQNPDDGDEAGCRVGAVPCEDRLTALAFLLLFARRRRREGLDRAPRTSTVA